jgi:hypothetical protein
VVLQAGGLSLSSRVMLSTFWGAKPYKFFDHTSTEGKADGLHAPEGNSPRRVLARVRDTTGV